MNTFRFVAIAASALLAAGAANAEAKDTIVQVSVKVYPNELATRAGRFAAIDRIERSVSNACEVGNTMIDREQQWRCQKQMTEQLVREVNNSELLEQWRGKNSFRTASVD